MRAAPLSRAASALSTPSLAAPFVSGPRVSRSSQACSMTRCRSLILRPQNGFEPLADIADALVDVALVITVVAALRAVVHPDRGHSERLRRNEVLYHVVGEQR